MSSNALSVSALEQVSFQLFAESVKTHSSSTQFCRQSVPRRRAAGRTLWMHDDQEQFLSADCPECRWQLEERSCRLPTIPVHSSLPACYSILFIARLY